MLDKLFGNKVEITDEFIGLTHELTETDGLADDGMLDDGNFE